jgi:gliding motility-associated-like protein
MTHHKLHKTLAALFISACTYAQITTSSLTTAQYVQNVLLGPGVTASNITFTGLARQIASFTSTPTGSLGLNRGVYLTTGTAYTGAGANNIGPTGPSSGFQSVDNGGAGDTFLDGIVGGFLTGTNDAAALEFDFVPQSDTVRFRYIFGSEEYNDYVNSVNDAFAFVLSGVTTTLAATNIALIPGTTTPITINDVNNGPAGVGQASSGPCTNCTYYRDNVNGSVNCVYDGLTTVLTAKAGVQCGETYHIKIVIADASDGIYDSGVFLEAGSFSSIPPISVSSSNSNASFTDTVMVEDCNVNCIYFVRTANVSQIDSFALQVGGTATLGSDYQQIGNPSFAWPSKLIFAAGQDSIPFCNLKAIDDNVSEPLEEILFTLTSYTTSATACALTATIDYKLYLIDYTAINISQGDSLICNGTGITMNAGAQFGVPAYTYSWSPDNSTNSSINTGPVTQVKNYTLTVNDICNKPVTKEITITPTTLPKITPVGPYRFCLDTIRKIPITITDGVPAFNINWQIPSGGIVPFDTINSTYHFVQSSNPGSGTYTVTISDQCNKTDTILVDITTVDCKIIVPNVVTPNGDNVNEFFKINALENFSNSQLLIYNRWGQKVYSNDDYKNNWKPDVNSGTYFYILNIKDGRSFNGFFQVFKD